MRIHETLPLLLFVAGALAACGGEDEHEHGDLEAEICEHMQDGPSMAITATGTAAAAADARAAHTRIDVALIDSAGMKGGFVAFTSDEATDWLVALDKNVPIVVTRASDGGSVMIEASESPIEACTEVAVLHTIPLEVGRYAIAFGPTSETEVRMVSEEAAHEE